MNQIVLDRVTKRFGKVVAVNNLSLEVRDREFLVIVGPSGCGKTTTLRLIAGLEDPDTGEVYIGGERVNDVDVSKRGVHMVFPSFALWPHMRVMDEKGYSNLSFPLKVRQWMGDRIKSRMLEVSQKVGIEESLFKRKPSQLSEGQKQKVAIGRAIVVVPRVLLMDDPMTNIDPPSRLQVREEILKVHRQVNTTTIYVTHNMADAMALADRIAVMRDGAVVQVGTPEEIYHQPLDSFVSGFVRSYEAALPTRWRKTA
ncbi:MAG: ABC transporter ATP-binding protein [Dehalococcoidia bacterium]|nr:ABC transporter ATP-binding protein [Dehalococcoidia bacterium]